MKTIINLKMMYGKEACSDAVVIFEKAHGQKTVLLSEALESNGLQEAFWWIQYNELTPEQDKDIRLLACTYAEHVLHIFEDNYPDDKRPRKAIEIARLYANGDVSSEDLKDARDAAADATRDATLTAADVADYTYTYAARAADAAAYTYTYAAAYAARAATYAYAAAYAYAYADADAVYERKYQKEELKKVFSKWEQVKC